MVVLEEIEPVDIDPRPGAAVRAANEEGDDDDMPPAIEEIPGSELSVPIKARRETRPRQPTTRFFFF